MLKIQIEPTCAMTMEAAFRWLKRQSQKKFLLFYLVVMLMTRQEGKFGNKITLILCQKTFKYSFMATQN